MQIELDGKLIEGLLNYLATRPWGEVQGFMPPLIAQLEKAAQPEPSQTAQLRAVPPAAAADT